MFFKKGPKTPEVLPEGWEAKEWGKKTVYVNHVTKETQWKKPKKPKTAAAPAAQPAEPASRVSPSPSIPVAASYPIVEPSAAPVATHDAATAEEPARGLEDASKTEDLPEGWRKVKTKEGETLYVNDVEQITSWDRPVVIAAPTVVPRHASEALVDNAFPGGEALAPPSPLPAGWSEGFTESGEKYYFNDHEQTSTWDKPSAVASMGGSAGEQKKEQLLPPGWSQAFTDDGEMYFRNHNTQTTSWEPPVF